MSSDADTAKHAYSSLERLPGEMVSAIAEHLSCYDILSLRLTSKKMDHEMDREMKWALDDLWRSSEMTLREILRLKWLGERRIAKHVEFLDLQQVPSWYFAKVADDVVKDDSLLGCPRGDGFDKLGLSPDEVWEFYKDGFAEVAKRALEGFENLKSVSLQLLHTGSPTPELDEFVGQYSWCLEALSFLLGALKQPVNLSINSGAFCWDIKPPHVNKRVSFEVEFDGRGADDWSGVFAVVWKNIRSTILSRCPSSLRLYDISLQRSDVYSMYWPKDAPEVLSLEKVHEDEFDEDSDSDSPLGALQALVSHPSRNLRELSVVGCIPRFPRVGWISFFEALKNHKNLQSLRFEKNNRAYFDWESDTKRDNGSRLPEIIKKFGMEKALDMMISAYRYTLEEDWG
ncbi:hypothetical protein HDK77DRAFT_292471 [Phyllosticta capitalensis]